MLFTSNKLAKHMMTNTLLLKIKNYSGIHYTLNVIAQNFCTGNIRINVRKIFLIIANENFIILPGPMSSGLNKFFEIKHNSF